MQYVTTKIFSHLAEKLFSAASIISTIPLKPTFKWQKHRCTNYDGRKGQSHNWHMGPKNCGFKNTGRWLCFLFPSVTNGCFNVCLFHISQNPKSLLCLQLKPKLVIVTTLKTSISNCLRLHCHGSVESTCRCGPQIRKCIPVTSNIFSYLKGQCVLA